MSVLAALALAQAILQLIPLVANDLQLLPQIVDSLKALVTEISGAISSGKQEISPEVVQAAIAARQAAEKKLEAAIAADEPTAPAPR